MDVKFNALAVFVPFVQWHLKFYFAEFCDYIMETIAENWCIFAIEWLTDGDVKFLEELLLTFD